MIIYNSGNATWKLEDGGTAKSGGVDVTAGRVSIFDFSDKVLGVLSDPKGGHVTVNPDGTVALVMTDPGQTGATSFDVKVQTASGSKNITVNLDVAKAELSGGWGEGDHYMLATDDGGNSIIEPGENHRKVYVTNGSDGLSLGDIAKLEGTSVSNINAKWLVNQSKYGGTEGKALDQKAGALLWYGLTEGLGNKEAAPGSHWLMLERGYSYSDLGRIIGRGAEGESELHPLLVTAWGQGRDPVIKSKILGYQTEFKNFAIVDVDIRDGMLLLEGENILLEEIDSTGHELNFQFMEDITIRRSTIVDAVDTDPHTSKTWDGSFDRKSGLFIKTSDGVLIEDSLADHNGWADGYDYNLSAKKPTPPSNRSHNFYVQKDVSDLTFRDNVSFEGASTGAQIRAGGLVEGNAFIGNNVGLLLGSGVNDTGNYSLLLDNLTTLAGYKEVKSWEGYLAVGLDNKAIDSVQVGNVITHLSDPTDTAAINSRTSQPGRAVLEEDTPLFDDTIIYNWETRNKPREDRNLPEGVSLSDLNDITVRNFVKDVLGLNPGTDGLDALSTWLRQVWSSDTLEAQKIIDYFREGFGLDADERTTNKAVRFTPTELSDGVRWDQRLNWSTEDVPIDGDSVDLGGNWVRYGGTTSLDALDLGDRGSLTVTQGLLETDSFTAGSDATLKIASAGQFWTNGYAGPALDIMIDGGRFANTGTFKSTGTVSVSDGEVLFGAGDGNFILDGQLDIVGKDAKLGFDGRGSTTARLTLDDDAVLSFSATGGKVASIEEFRSGHWGTAAPKVTSSVDLSNGSAELELSGVSGSSRQVLIEADQIEGGFGKIDVTGNRLSINLDHDKDILDVAAVSSSGKSTFNQFGSSEKDVFYVAKGVQNLINDYQGKDIVNLSSHLNPGDKVTLKASSGDLLLNSGSTLLARLSPTSDSGLVRVGIDGQNWLLGLDGSVKKLANDANAGEIDDDGPATGGGGGDGSNTGGGSNPNGALIGVGLTEAEDLDLEGYVAEARAGSSGGTSIRTSDSGTASGTFSGEDGFYKIRVDYLNEDDGRSDWTLLVNGEVLTSWNGAGGTNTLEMVEIEADLETGDEIVLQGLRDTGEFARIDSLGIESLEPAAGEIDDDGPGGGGSGGGSNPNGALIGVGLTEAEDLDLEGYVAEARAGSSGGASIRTSNSGTASGVFSGEDDSYVIRVDYLNEDDGRSDWALLVNGEVLTSWDGAGGTNALETVEIEADLETGDEIVLQGLRDTGEFARIDSLEIEAQEPEIDLSELGVALIGVGLTEAEDLDLEGYVAEARTINSGGALIKTSNSGTASGVFSGEDDSYVIRVDYLNEDDGRSDWALLVNGEVLTSWNGAGGRNNVKTVEIEADLETGDEIILQGMRDNGEFARIDSLEIV